MASDFARGKTQAHPGVAARWAAVVKKRKYGARVVPFALESSSGGWLGGEAKGLTDKVVEHMSEHAKKAAAAFKIQRAIGIELIMHLQ